MLNLPLEKPKTLLGILCLTHLIVWVLLPALLWKNPPLDMIEAVTWGSSLQWGYEKHPPLTAWLTTYITSLFSAEDWKVYFILSPLSVVFTFWGMWRVARLYLPERESFLSVLLLEGCYYYHFTSPEFNPNVLLLPFWAWFCYFFYRAVMDEKAYYWLATGVFAALAILTKYTAALVFISAFFLLIFTEKGRRSFKSSGIYLGASIFLFDTFLHWQWVLENGLSTLNYIETSTHKAEYSVFHHIFYPFRFISTQILAISGVIIAFFIAFKGNIQQKPLKINKDFHTAYPWVIGLGPVVLTLLFSFLTGAKIKSMWGSPLWSFTGILLFLAFAPRCTAAATKRCILAISFVFLLFSAGYAASNSSRLLKRTHFPGQELALKVTDIWHAHYNSPLPVVAGSQWLAGNVAFFSIDKPLVYDELNTIKSQWMDDARFAERGGIIIWRYENKHTPNHPNQWQKRFPQARLLPPLSLNWQFSQEKTPILLGIALVLPAGE